MYLLLACFIFLALPCGHASQLNWPKDHYTISSTNVVVINTFRNYFELLKTKYATKYSSSFDRMDFLDHGNVILTIRIKRYRNFDLITYQSYSNGEGKVNSIKIFSDHKLSNLELLNFDLFSLVNANTYKIDFIGFQNSLNVDTNSDTKLCTFSFSWGAIYLREIYRTDELSSRLWYSCSNCNGDPLYFIYSNYENIERKSYFKGTSQVPVTPTSFYNSAKYGYLGEVYRQIESVLSILKSYYGWPSL